MKIKFPLFLLAVVFLFLNTYSFGQNEKEKYLQLIGDWDKDFERTDIPEKWAAESAVILAEKQDYSSTKIISDDLTWRSSFRRRIKLLDKAAVVEFSFFYFSG